MKKFKILAINPGSTSTKVSVFENEKEIFTDVLRHTDDELAPFKRITDQYEWRKDVILKALSNHNIDPNELDATVGRGGLLYPMAGGTYKVNELMLDHLKRGVQGEHASNIGGLIAHSIGDNLGIPSFIVDPVVVDEMWDLARLSGHPKIERRSIFHALNQKACARKTAEKMGKKYQDLNLIVVHLGGGISVGAHRKGQVIDVNNALNGDGPYTPQRSGGLPCFDLAKLCMSGEYELTDIKKMLKGDGGVKAYLGTSDIRDICDRIEKGDKKAEYIFKGMAYQVSKEVGACAAALSGDVDAIVLTGGIAYSEIFVNLVKSHVSFISDVHVIPGEAEMEALAMGGLRVLNGEENPKTYNPS